MGLVLSVSVGCDALRRVEAAKHTCRTVSSGFATSAPHRDLSPYLMLGGHCQASRDAIT